MTGRESLAQQPPPHDASLERFPTRSLPRGRHLYRAHHRGMGAWWFGSGGDGRFDLPEPAGTCYLAESATVALRERLGPVLGAAPRVPAALVDGVVVSALSLQSTVTVANTRTSAAGSFGVLRELATMVPYDIPHQWALAWWRVGHGGVAYDPRFTPGRMGAVALFGPHGPRSEWATDDAPTAAQDVRGAPSVIRAPAKAQLTVVPPPRT